MKYLIVVDMQNDFIDGTLGSKEAAAVVDKVKTLCESFDGEIVFTRDTHTVDYLTTQEGTRLPVKHCIKDTDGWQICSKLRGISEQARIIDKPTFGSVELCEYIKSKENAQSITLAGVCTDICVISNAMLLKAYLPETQIAVKAECCAGVTPESHNIALSAMRGCQIDIL